MHERKLKLALAQAAAGAVAAGAMSAELCELRCCSLSTWSRQTPWSVKTVSPEEESRGGEATWGEESEGMSVQTMMMMNEKKREGALGRTYRPRSSAPSLPLLLSLLLQLLLLSLQLMMKIVPQL